METPTLDQFIEHGEVRLQIMGENPKAYRKSLISKFLAWSDNDWKTGNGRKIKNWKSTLSNTLPYLKAERIEVVDSVEVKSKLNSYG